MSSFQKSVISLLSLTMVLAFGYLPATQAKAPSAPKYWHERIDAPPAKKKMMPNYIQINQRTARAVVNIFTAALAEKEGNIGITGEDNLLEKFFEALPISSQHRQSLGSGFIIHEDGYLITNAHLVDKTASIKIFQGLRPQEYPCDIIGIDKATDIALLKIMSKSKFPYLYLGDSGLVEVGEWVMVVGNPFGFANSVTQGIVSGKGRDLTGTVKGIPQFIQTDAAINPGNSGGPMLNYRGEVIGINTALSTSSLGIGFAIPINTAKSVIPKLKEHGRVIRGYLGIVVQSLTPNLAQGLGINLKEGALIIDVISGSPAEKAGLKNKDVIVTLNGKTIANANAMHAVVEDTKPGKLVPAKVLRGSEYLLKQVTLIEAASRNADEEMPKKTDDFDLLGLSVENTLPYGSGVTVTSISPDGLAQKSGIIYEDTIFELTIKKPNKKPLCLGIKNSSDYKKVLQQLSSGDILTFLVNRYGSPMYIALKF